MNQHWERVTSLFGAARALDGQARASFLDLACAGDDELRADVDSLLAADVPDDDFLSDPPWATLSSFDKAQLEPGHVLKDRYRIDSELATGGQALVYRATDLLLARPVVIKVMKVEGRRHQWLKSRFEQERQALARIDHPGVVGILDVGDLDDGSPFLVIQYIPGISLRQALSNGPLPPARAASLLRQIGSALRGAHREGIAHRDLKPENIMLQHRDGSPETVKLIDFGIAKVDKSGIEPRTTTVMIAGTIRYMAPEQFDGDNSPASDVYSMAIVACEMISGHPDIRALPKSTRADVRTALESALAFRPAERPSDVERWSDRLADGLGEGRRRTTRLISGVIAVALLGGVAIAGGRWLAKAEAEPPRIVEKVGGFDPLTEGFETHNDIRGTVTENPTRTGYDGWELFTHRQGYYFHAFTAAQKRRALSRGWTLTAVLSGAEGGASVGADFTGVGPRFDINVLEDRDREIVRLQTQIVPDPRGIEIQQQPPKREHTYKLIYDPSLKSADLWIDNERRISGYRGHSQFLEDRGLLFGATVYKSDSAFASFKSVRFEINP